jgi:hypothetical protein
MKPALEEGLKHIGKQSRVQIESIYVTFEDDFNTSIFQILINMKQVQVDRLRKFDQALVDLKGGDVIKEVKDEHIIEQFEE